MGETVQNQVLTEFVVTGHARAQLEEIAGAAHKVDSKIGAISEKFGDMAKVAGLAMGAMSFESIYESTVEHFGAVKQIVDVTGLAVEKADALTEIWEKAGIPMSEASRIMMTLSKNGAKMADHAASMGGGIANTAHQMKKLGVDIKKGPYQAMIDLSAAVQSRKLGADQLALTFGIRLNQAYDFVKVLKKGPDYIKDTVREMQESGLAITQENLSNFGAMREAQRSLAAGWTRVKVTLGKELFPLFQELAEEMEGKAAAWAGYAKEFGHALKFALTDGLGVAKALTKVLLTNYAIQKATAGGMFGKVLQGAEKEGVGIVGASRAVFKWAMPAERAAVSKIAYGGGGAGSGAATSLAIPLITKLSQGKWWTTLIEGASKLARIGGGLLKLTGIGLIIDRVVAGFLSVMHNAEAMSALITEPFERLVVSLQPVWDLFDSMFGEGSPIGPGSAFAEVFQNIIPMAVGGLFDVLTLMVHGAKMIALILNEAVHLRLPDLSKIAASISESEDATAAKRASARAVQKAKSEATSERPPTVYNDFRNSKFDITQQFAEGVDPDRIAVALPAAIRKLSSRKLGSSLTKFAGGARR